MRVDGAAMPVESRLLLDLPAAERVSAAAILAKCRTVELEPAAPQLSVHHTTDALLIVEAGFVVLRSADPAAPRSVITCEAGAGRILLPPSREEVLVALEPSRLTVLDTTALAELLTLPAAAAWIVGRLTLALAQRQEACGNLAATLHVERVRRMLLQLARTYGHPAREGVRIDFPVSHAVLAEMVASSRETVTRAVDELQRRGFVTRRGSTYWLRARTADDSRGEQRHGA
jgi:Crp-like helix-turn-helix domain